MGSKKDKPQIQVVMYRMGIHYGICSGPVDYIRRIVINDKIAWVGTKATQGDIYINKPNLFGGLKKEGGAIGNATYLPGEDDQVISEFLSSKVDLTSATMPAYRGIASIWFAEAETAERVGFYWTANTPYIPPVKIRVARASIGLPDSLARIYRSLNGDVALYFLLDRSASLSSAEFLAIKNAAKSAIDEIEAFQVITKARVDIVVRFYSTGSVSTDHSSAGPAQFDIIRAFIDSAVQVGGGDVLSAMTIVKAFHDARLSTEFTKRAVILVTDSTTEDGMTAAAAGPAADMLDQEGGSYNLESNTAVDMYAINYNTSNTTWTGLLDNTPQDGIPIIAGTDEAGLVNAVLDTLRGAEFDSNPAHIIYECLTNTDWGMGSPTTSIDYDSFLAAAQTLYDEEFGLSMIWTKQSSIESFVTEILDHIEATLFVNPLNGLLTLKLIRFDYSISSLPIFTPDNSVVTRFSRKLWGETINEIVVTFTNPENEQPETIVAQDLANIEAQGGIVSDARNYYGVRVATLAAGLAQRDLRTAASPLAACDIEVNRDAWNLLPGDVLILNSPEDNINQIVMRVGPVDYGKPGESIVRASLAEDVFSLAAADYHTPPGTDHDDTEEFPLPAENTYIFTLPYYGVVNAVGTSVLAEMIYPEVFAAVMASQQGTDSSDFDLYGEITDSGGNVTIGDLGTKAITVHAELAVALVEEINSTILTFSNRTSGSGPSVGGLILIGDGDEDTTEIGLITAFGISGYTVRRGCLDTTPKAWPIGTSIWFLNAGQTVIDTEIRSDGETVDYQVLTRTSLGLLDLASAPIVSDTLTGRPHYPLRPANVKVNSIGFGGVNLIAVSDPIPVTWANRNRELEDSQILAWDAATVTPETGQTTKVEILADDLSVLYTYAGISGTSQDILRSDFDGNSSGYIRVTSVRDGLSSLQGHTIEVILLSGGGLSLEDGFDLLLETGDRLLLEAIEIAGFAEAASYSFTGTAAVPKHAWKIAAAAASYSFTGIAADPIYSQNTPAAIAYKSADQTSANYNTGSVVTWDSEVYDDVGWHNNSSNTSRMTVPSGTSYVQMAGQIQYANNTSKYELMFYKNGSVLALTFTEQDTGSPGTALVISAPVAVSPGDYLELFYITSGDSSTDVIAAGSYLAIWKVG